jgi:hypothetical protein
MTIRLTRELAGWLEQTAAGTGRSQGAIVREQLERGLPTPACWSRLRTATTSTTTGRSGWPKDLTEPLLTCEAVLAETTFHLQDTSLTLAMVADGLVAVAFDVRAHLPHLATLAKRYADRRPDLADLCLIRMSELHPRHHVVTTDVADFRAYRRNRREAIPLILPPAR